MTKHGYSTTSPSVCIIGSGPAGFGITQYLLKNHATVKVDMVEKYPVPYGLIRYGVSPDHQNVKNCIHKYEKIAVNPRFSFFGNVAVGSVISLRQLIERYNAVVMCYGAQKTKLLKIPGEELGNVFTANQFVGWYNGVPEWSNLDPDLSCEEATIIGVGNVALDCARMLLKPVVTMKDIDLPSYTMDKLLQSNIKIVNIIGRRGPLQMACTRRELSEICDLDNIETIADHSVFTEEVKNALKIKDLKLRKTQRLVKYLNDVLNRNFSTTVSTGNSEKEFNIKLLRSPVEITGTNSVSSVVLRKNILSGPDAFNPVITSSEETETIGSGLVISCLGYDNEPLESDVALPFNQGRIENKHGKVDNFSSLYACGWCKSGAKGVLADTLNDSIVTGSTIVDDLNNITGSDIKDPNLCVLLKKKNIRYLTWDDWKTLDQFETRRGLSQGKIREKITSVDEMLNL